MTARRPAEIDQRSGYSESLGRNRSFETVSEPRSSRRDPEETQIFDVQGEGGYSTFQNSGNNNNRRMGNSPEPRELGLEELREEEQALKDAIIVADLKRELADLKRELAVIENGKTKLDLETQAIKDNYEQKREERGALREAKQRQMNEGQESTALQNQRKAIIEDRNSRNEAYNRLRTQQNQLIEYKKPSEFLYVVAGGLGLVGAAVVMDALLDVTKNFESFDLDPKNFNSQNIGLILAGIVFFAAAIALTIGTYSMRKEPAVFILNNVNGETKYVPATAVPAPVRAAGKGEPVGRPTQVKVSVATKSSREQSDSSDDERAPPSNVRRAQTNAGAQSPEATTTQLAAGNPIRPLTSSDVTPTRVPAPRK